MARVEFTKEQEKALIKYLIKRFVGKRCYNCKHERGSCVPMTKICKSCNNYSKWQPNTFLMPYIDEQLEIIKSNK